MTCVAAVRFGHAAGRNLERFCHVARGGRILPSEPLPAVRHAPAPLRRQVRSQSLPHRSRGILSNIIFFLRRMNLCFERPEKTRTALLHQAARIADDDHHIAHIPGSEANGDAHIFTIETCRQLRVLIGLILIEGFMHSLQVLDAGAWFDIARCVQPLINSTFPHNKGVFRVRNPLHYLPYACFIFIIVSVCAAGHVWRSDGVCTQLRKDGSVSGRSHSARTLLHSRTRRLSR